MAMPCTSSASAAVTTSSTERLWPRWTTSTPFDCRMRRMMLIEASWPSNSEAAVTKRTLLVSLGCSGASAIFGAERSFMVSLVCFCNDLSRVLHYMTFTLTSMSRPCLCEKPARLRAGFSLRGVLAAVADQGQQARLLAAEGRHGQLLDVAEAAHFFRQAGQLHRQRVVLRRQLGQQLEGTPHPRAEFGFHQVALGVLLGEQRRR